MKENLYSARYYILKNMPEGVAKRALLATLRPILGREPAWYVAGGEDAPEELPDLDTEPDPGTPAGLRIAWVVGHNEAAPGAWLKPPISESEFVFNNKVVDHILDLGIPNVEMRKFNRVPNARGYTAEIAQCYAEVNRWKPHLVFELHFNGGGGNYSVMLIAKGSKGGRIAADKTQAEVVADYGFSDKGIWERTKGERGGASLYAAEAPMVMTEPFFGDNPAHAAKVYELGAHPYLALTMLDAAKATLRALYAD